MIDVKNLESVPFENRGKLPNISGIYFVIQGAEILYIGKAISIARRWIGHHVKWKIQKLPGVRIAWHPTCQQDLDTVERDAINHFNPSLNGTRYNIVRMKPIVLEIKKSLLIEIDAARAKEGMNKSRCAWIRDAINSALR